MSEPKRSGSKSRFRITSIIIAILMLGGIFGVLIGPFTINVSAVPDTHTWDGGGADAFAGTHENWVSDIAPEAADSVIFNAGALPCTWNLSITLDNFSMVTGYTGILTIGANFGVTSFYQIAGTLTGSASYVLTSSGNVCHGGTGAMSGQLLRLIMTGEGTKLTGIGDYRLLGLQASANITVTHVATLPVFLSYSGSPYLAIDTGKTLTIASGKQFNLYLLSTLTFSNQGIIAGPGILDFRAFGTDKAITFGTITAPVQMWISSTEAASRTISLGANTIFESTLSLWSSHATNTITLSHGTNYELLVAGQVIMSARAILTQGTGAWTFGSYYQYGSSSAFNQGGPLTINGALTQSNGLFTGNENYVATIYGSITHSGTANVSTHCLRIRMMGEGTTLTGIDGTAGYRLLGLHISANVTVTELNTTVYLAYAGSPYLTVDAGKTLTITSGKQLNLYLLSTFTYSNLGTIAGPGILDFRLFGTNKEITFGTITAPVQMWISSTEAASRTISLGANTTFESTLSLWSSHATNTITLSHGTNYELLVAGQVIMSARAILTQGTGAWTFGSYNQYGLSSAFNQNGEIRIDGDFLQTEGIINSINSSITVGANWSSSNSYINTLVVNGSSHLSLGSDAIDVSMAADYTEIPGTSNFSGPGNVMIKAQNGDFLAFVREGKSHVEVGDYAVMNLYRSTDDGVTWNLERTLVNVTNRDVRNYASGVSQTGRVFVFYMIYDVDNGTWPNAQYYNYSDDDGASWSEQQILTMPILDALIPTNGGQVWGKIHPIADGAIGFTFYTGNATATQGRFVSSFDDGMTWNQHIIWASSNLPNALTETDSIYIGDGRIIACSRTDNVNGIRMFTSIDNGLTWTDRGIGIYNSVRPPTLTKVIDDLDRIWALLVLAYGNSVFYSIAFADTLMDEGVSAWPYAEWLSQGLNGGMYATIVLNDTTGIGLMMVNYQSDFHNSTNRVFNMTASVNCTIAILSNLTINAGCSADLESREFNLGFVVLNKVINAGQIFQNGKNLNITGSSSTPLTGYGTFDGNLYLNGSTASSYSVQIGLPMGNLHTDRDTTINIDVIHSIRAIPSSGWLNISIESLMKWVAQSTDPNAAVTFTLSGLDSGVCYKVYVDDVIAATIIATGGQISFDYSTWSTQSHTFEIVVPTTYESPDEVTPPPSDKSPATSDPGATSFTWTSLTMIAIACVSIMVAVVLILRRPRGSSGRRHS